MIDPDTADAIVDTILDELIRRAPALEEWWASLSEMAQLELRRALVSIVLTRISMHEHIGALFRPRVNRQATAGTRSLVSR